MLCMVGDGPDREQLERRAHELGIVRDTLFLGYQEDVAPFYAAFDALVLPSGERGDAGERDRGARGRAAGRGDAGRRRPDVVATARTASSSSPARRTTLAERLERLARDPSSASGWARPAASACCPATRSTAWWTTSTAVPVAAGRKTGSARLRFGSRSARGVAATPARLVLPHESPTPLIRCPAGSQPAAPSRSLRASVRQAREALNAGLRFRRPSEPDCQPSHVRVVAEHEPDHQVDPRVRSRDRERLASHRRPGARTRRRRGGPAGRLPRVLGDPDPLLAPEPVHLGDQRVDVPELDRVRRPGFGVGVSLGLP